MNNWNNQNEAISPIEQQCVQPKTNIEEKSEISREQLLYNLTKENKIRWKDNYLSFFWKVQTPTEDVLKIIWAEEKLTKEAEERLDDYYNTDQPSYDMQQDKLYYSWDNIAYVNWKPAEYSMIDWKDSIEVYLADLWNWIWHLIIDCYPSHWKETCFVLLNDKWQILMSEKNSNPNPVSQIWENWEYKA